MFPFPRIRTPFEPENASARIDRHLADRTQRLSAGISLRSDFRMLSGALLVTRGRGKFLRVNQVFSNELSVPESLSEELRRIVAVDTPSVTDVAQARFDLADLQAQLVEEIKTNAGKYVDRLLAVSVDDPGMWTSDFDGQLFYSSLCNGQRLAELCGLNVLDGFPDRDIAVGGSGQNLEALPLWLLLADRNERIARNTNTVIRIGQSSRLFVLPPSNGLDAHVPEIRCFHMPGLGLIEGLINALGPAKDTEYSIADLYVDGNCIPELLQSWSREWSEPRTLSVNRQRSAQSVFDLDERLVKIAVERFGRVAAPLSSIVRTAFDFVVDRIKSQLKNSLIANSADRATFDRIWIASAAKIAPSCVNLFQREFPHAEVESTQRMSLDDDQLSAVVVGLHGLLHIDQMPCNVPWITGAESLRTLGNLTPGRPSNWRKLVMEMADFQPPAMKLKDAV